MWLVQWRTLPFLQGCSMLVVSVLNDRQLPASIEQCKIRLAVLSSQVSRGRLDGRFQSLGRRAEVAPRARLWSVDESARAIRRRNLRRLEQIMPVSGGWSVHQRTSSFETWVHQGIHTPFVKCMNNKTNKAIVDIRFCPHCAIPPLPLLPIGRITCARIFSEYNLCLPGILNDPICCVTLLAIEWSLLQQTPPRRCSDSCSEDWQCFWMGQKTPKISPFPWDFVTLPEEDRAWR